MVIAPRFKVYAAVVLVLALTAIGLSALAQEGSMAGLSFTMEADPATMTSPGKTKITVRLANSGQNDITVPMALYDADDKAVPSFFDGGTLSALKVGETQVWSGDYQVSQAQLEAGKVIFTLKSSVVDSNGNVAQLNMPAEAKLTYIGEKVDLSISRTVTPEVARKDQTVTVQFELVNNGNVKLTDIKLREHSSISSKTEAVAALEPGGSATVKFEKKMSTGDLTSHPNLTYKKEGSKELLRATLDTLTIPAAKPNLKLGLTADKTSVNIGDTAVLTLTMTNDGNVSYSGVTVKDAKLGEVFTNVDIPARQTVTLTKEVTMLETTTFQFELALKDNTGTSQTEKTPALKVSAYDPAKMVRLTLEMSADKQAIISMPGEIYFTVVVTNNSDFEVKDIRLSQAGARVYTVAALQPGKSVTVTRQYMLSQAGKYQFVAEVTDSQSNTQQFESNVLEIAYSPATPPPTPEVYATVPPVVTYTPVPASAVTAAGGSQGLNALFVLTAAVGALFGVAFLLFAASTAMRVIANRRSEAAYDHLARTMKRDFSDASTYAKPEDENAAQDAPKHTEPESAAGSEAAPAPKESAREEAAAQPLPEETGYRLTRAAEDTENAPAEPRSRRASKHNK